MKPAADKPTIELGTDPSEANAPADPAAEPPAENASAAKPRTRKKTEKKVDEPPRTDTDDDSTHNRTPAADEKAEATSKRKKPVSQEKPFVESEGDDRRGASLQQVETRAEVAAVAPANNDVVADQPSPAASASSAQAVARARVEDVTAGRAGSASSDKAPLQQVETRSAKDEDNTAAAVSDDKSRPSGSE